MNYTPENYLTKEVLHLMFLLFNLNPSNTADDGFDDAISCKIVLKANHSKVDIRGVCHGVE